MKSRQVSIWFIIGLQLLIMGLIILGAGIQAWIWPPADPVRYQYLHPEVYEAVALILLGIVYTVGFRPRRTPK